MNLLAFDTSTEACSVALRWNGRTYSRHEIAPRAHGDLILPMVDAVMNESGGSVDRLDGIAVGRGPGGFTGVRIAISVAQGLSLGASVPVLAVSSLAAMALGAHRQWGWERVLCAFDARMGEVYWGAFETAEGEATNVGGEQVCAPEAVQRPANGRWSGCGTGFATYSSALADRLGVALETVNPVCYPHGLDVLTLGAAMLSRHEGVSADAVTPVYLRDRVVSVSLRGES